MPSNRVTFPMACCLAATFSGTAMGQSGPRPALAPGTFTGRDSLDARSEPGTASRVRSRVDGTATWTIELDSLDLRRKFTIRLEVSGPLPVTIVLRAMDTLPLALGMHGTMIPSAGASHRSRGTVHAGVYAREGDRSRSYEGISSSVSVTSIPMNGVQPVVVGRIKMRSLRYADRKPGGMNFPTVHFDISGDFAARAASDPRPRIAVTSAMQEQVLTRALHGFAITSSGAINGDGDADSTRETGLARRFLESRWSHTAVIERLEVNGTGYTLRLRGRQAPVVCEMESPREVIECTTLPAPVTGGGGKGRVSGTVTLQLAPRIPAYAAAVAVHLLPNPAPLKDAFRAWCAGRERADSIAGVALEASMSAARDSAAQERAFAAHLDEHTPPYRDGYRALFASFATLHATVGPDGRYVFPSVPSGNYLIVSALPSRDRLEWYLPIVVHAGEQLSRDLDGSNVNMRGWGCGTPLPFPAVHGRKK